MTPGGTVGPAGDAQSGSVRLAVFDLDGTLTRSDTLLPYALGFMLREPWRLPGLLLFVPTVILFSLGRVGHGEVKSAFIRAALGGSRRSKIEAWTARFVPGLVARSLLADALEQVALHKREGARLVLMSASTDLYVPAIAQALGFHETICTGVRWNGDRLDGHLSTPNRRGAEKARCFEALRQRHPGLPTAAYGNAGSDLDHMRLADHALLVNAPASARQEAARLGIRCATWR